MGRHFASRLIMVSLFGMLGFAELSTAQQTTGTVQGVVIDQSGAVVPAAQLELRHEDTNAVMTQRSTDEGFYIFSYVPPGLYTLTASSPQFKTKEITGIVVAVAKNAVVDVLIEAGSVDETIVVRAATALIDTRSAVVQTHVDEPMLRALPLASRNALEAAKLAPGVAIDVDRANRANVSGGRTQGNTFYLDGTDNSGPVRNFGLQMPNPEAVQEVQVTSSTNSAEFGRQPGGFFNVITKSGTNTFDGSAFYYGTDERLNANSWERNRNNLPKTPANEKQIGFTAGGPIVRDRTFFFGAYQHHRDESTQLNQTVRFPTEGMLAGDFSEFGGQLYHPDTQQPIPDNDLAVAGLLDAVAVAYAREMIPTVASLGDRLVWEFESPVRSHEALLKIDHNIGQTQRIMGSLFRTWGNRAIQASNVPTTANSFGETNQTTSSLRHMWVLGNTAVLESRFSRASHEAQRTLPASVTGWDLSDFGARWPVNIQDGPKLLTGVEIRDGFSTRVNSDGLSAQENLRFGTTYTWIKGAHTFKAGYEAQEAAVERRDEDGIPESPFRFQGRFSNRGVAPSGEIPNALFAHSMADFMMGRIEDFSAAGPITYNVSSWSHSWFVQDEWKLTPKLTVTPGLRYEIYNPFTEKNGRVSAFIEGHQSDRFPNAPLHFAFQGDAGVPQGFIRTDKNNLAPRLGAVYDILGNGMLALRGAYGVYYAYPAAQTKVWAATEFPMVARAGGQEARLRDPWGTSQVPRYEGPPTPFPVDTREYLTTFVFTPPYLRNIGFDAEFQTPYYHQWNATAEYALTPAVTINAAYVGNRGRHLLRAFPFNYARYVVVDGEPPSSSASNIVARVPFPDLSRFSLRVKTDTQSWYDALQVSSHLRFGTFSGRVIYTWAFRSKGDGGGGAFTPDDEDPESFTSQVNNPANPGGEIGNRERRHTFRLFSVYALPFFADQQGWLGKLLGGWQLSSIISVLSGWPLDLILGYDANFDAITSRPHDRPDLVGPIRYTSGLRDERMARYVDPGAFAAPTITAESLGGSLPRNAIWGPGRWFADMALAKEVPLAHDLRAQLRLEIYNVFNHPNLGNPSLNMSSTDFNRILTLDGNRTMQFAVKVSF